MRPKRLNCAPRRKAPRVPSHSVKEHTHEVSDRVGSRHSWRLDRYLVSDEPPLDYAISQTERCPPSRRWTESACGEAWPRGTRRGSPPLAPPALESALGSHPAEPYPPFTGTLKGRSARLRRQ